MIHAREQKFWKQSILSFLGGEAMSHGIVESAIDRIRESDLEAKNKVTEAIEMAENAISMRDVFVSLMYDFSDAHPKMLDSLRSDCKDFIKYVIEAEDRLVSLRASKIMAEND